MRTYLEKDYYVTLVREAVAKIQEERQKMRHENTSMEHPAKRLRLADGHFW
jgi:hypothetical protein